MTCAGAPENQMGEWKLNVGSNLICFRTRVGSIVPTCCVLLSSQDRDTKPITHFELMRSFWSSF